MKKITTFIPFLFVMTLFIGCDDHDNAPEPVKQLRAKSVSYGELSYRILNYDDQNRITSITNGFIDDGDSAEYISHIIYAGDKIARLEIPDQGSSTIYRFAEF